jgi:predicted secreted protein
MQTFTGFALYFIFWWLTLFTILPISMRSQADENHVVPGTVKSAPAKFKPLRVFGMTTLIAGLIFGLFYLVSFVFGLTTDSIPRMYPTFDGK